MLGTRSLALASVLGLGCGAGGCSHYTPHYMPPDGSRVRPVWEGNRVAWSGPTELPRCLDEIPPEAVARWQQQAASAGAGGSGGGGGWSGGFVVVVVGPPHHHPMPPLAPHHVAGWMLLSSLGSGDEKAAAYVLAGMAVAALVASPAVAIALAASSPEPADEVAREIDAINRFNDRVRELVAECMNRAAAQRGAG
jgi:hypothetical protein